MITHIVFNEADIKVLEEAIALEQGLEGNVIQIKDDYAVGPLRDIYIGEGIENRKNWWREVLQGGDADGSVDDGSVDDQKTVAELVGKMRREEISELWIWMAPNKHDISGYYWLLHYMKEFQGRVMVLYMNNLPFFNEKGNIFYPNWLHEIPAKEFLKARKLAREITLSEFEVDPDEWQRLVNEDKAVRLFEGGKKLIQADYDYYDAELKKFITADWQKGSKIINQFLSKSKQTTGDMYLLWRLKVIITMGNYDVQGKIENMKDFEIKQKAAVEA